MAIAGGSVDPRIVVDGIEVRKLLTTVWFRSAFQRLSDAWRERLLDALSESLVLPNHAIRTRRGLSPLNTLDFEAMQEVYSRSFVADAARGDLELLLAAGRLWGGDAITRFRFESDAAPPSSRFGALIQSLRP
jgi:hypothetical protein